MTGVQTCALPISNVDEIFADITEAGQHPRKYADTYIMLEQVGHRLDREVERKSGAFGAPDFKKVNYAFHRLWRLQ